MSETTLEPRTGGGSPVASLLSGAAEMRLIAAALEKLPMLDLHWPDEIQASWWRCFEAAAKFVRKPQPDNATSAATEGRNA